MRPPHGRDVPRVAVPRDARLGRPGAELGFRHGSRVLGVGRAVERQFHGRAGGAGAAQRLNGHVDPLRMDHAGHEGDPERRHRREGLRGLARGVDPGTPHHRHTRPVRIHAEQDGVLAVLENVVDPGPAERSAQEPAQGGAGGPGLGAAAGPQQPEAGDRLHPPRHARHQRAEAGQHDEADRHEVDDVGPLGAEQVGEPPRMADHRQRAEMPALVRRGDDPHAGRHDARPQGLVAHPHRHGHVEARRPCRHGDGQEVGGEEPVLGDDEEQLGGRFIATLPGAFRGGPGHRSNIVVSPR